VAEPVRPKNKGKTKKRKRGKKHILKKHKNENKECGGGLVQGDGASTGGGGNQGHPWKKKWGGYRGVEYKGTQPGPNELELVTLPKKKKAKGKKREGKKRLLLLEDTGRGGGENARLTHRQGKKR